MIDEQTDAKPSGCQPERSSGIGIVSLEIDDDGISLILVCGRGNHAPIKIVATHIDDQTDALAQLIGIWSRTADENQSIGGFPG